MKNKHNPNPNSGDDINSLEGILAQVVVRCGEGIKIDYDHLTNTHAEFMPELGRRLRILQNLETVVLQIEQDSRYDVDPIVIGKSDDGLQMLHDRLDGYDVLERIFYGGQGVVYKARQRATSRLVAIKILVDGPLASERQRWRFLREIKLGARFQHPHIVTVYESGEVNGREFLAMEYIDGLPIDDYVLLHGLSVQQTVRIFQKVCGGISHAHQNGVMHRDIKPANILVDDDSQPHVLDFGLAKELDSEDGHSEHISIEGLVLGTLPYLSPEQARGDQDQVDVLSDVYALGVVLFRLLTGEYPYEIGGSRRHVLNNIIKQPPKKLREILLEVEPSDEFSIASINDDLEHIVCKALEKDKALRYQSAAAFAEDLERYLSGEAVDARATHQLYLLKKTLRRFRTHIAVSVIFITLLTSGLVGMTMLWRRAENVAKIAQTGLQMGSFLRLGSAQRDEGQTEQGIALLRKVIELGEFSNTKDPFVLRHMSTAHYTLAEELMKVGLNKEADTHCKLAVHYVELLNSQEPENPQWLRFTGLSHELRGRLASKEKQWSVALEEYESAQLSYSNLLAIHSDNLSLQVDMIFLLRHQAKCYHKLGNAVEATNRFMQALTICHELLLNNPNVLDYRMELCKTQLQLAVFHLSQNTPSHNVKASKYFRDAKTALVDLIESGRGRSRVYYIEKLLDNIETNQGILHRQSSIQS